MIMKSKGATAAALATYAIMLAGSLFAAGSASAAQGTKVTVAPSHAKVITNHNCDRIVILTVSHVWADETGQYLSLRRILEVL
jgi:hypothetical protein